MQRALHDYLSASVGALRRRFQRGRRDVTDLPFRHLERPQRPVLDLPADRVIVSEPVLDLVIGVEDDSTLTRAWKVHRSIARRQSSSTSRRQASSVCRNGSSVGGTRSSVTAVAPAAPCGPAPKAPDLGPRAPRADPHGLGAASPSGRAPISSAPPSARAAARCFQATS